MKEKENEKSTDNRSGRFDVGLRRGINSWAGSHGDNENEGDRAICVHDRPDELLGWPILDHLFERQGYRGRRERPKRCIVAHEHTRRETWRTEQQSDLCLLFRRMLSVANLV
jgi:hypothetical protein